MDKKKKELTSTSIFDRVVSILEQAKTNVVHTVNSEMVLAYWLIGREIVNAIQSGDKRAEYGKGFSATNLWYFRQFYVVYSNREPEIRHKACGVLNDLTLAIEKIREMTSKETGFPKLINRKGIAPPQYGEGISSETN